MTFICKDILSLMHRYLLVVRTLSLREPMTDDIIGIEFEGHNQGTDRERQRKKIKLVNYLRTFAASKLLLIRIHFSSRILRSSTILFLPHIWGLTYYDFGPVDH